MESNAAGLVLRPALKTGFSEMGWGSTPLLSAKANSYLVLMHGNSTVVSDDGGYRNYQVMEDVLQGATGVC